MELDLTPPQDDNDTGCPSFHQDSRVAEMTALMTHLHGNVISGQEEEWKDVQEMMFQTRSIPSEKDQEAMLWHHILAALAGATDEVPRRMIANDLPVHKVEGSLEKILETTLKGMGGAEWRDPMVSQEISLEELLAVLCRCYRHWWQAIGGDEVSGEKLEARMRVVFLRRFRFEIYANHSVNQGIVPLVPAAWNCVDSRLVSWMKYIEEAQEKVRGNLPNEQFSLDEIYIELRGAFLQPSPEDEGQPQRVGVWLEEHVTTWVTQGDLANPLMAIVGEGGSGKSAFSKIFVARRGVTLFRKAITTLHVPIAHLKDSESLESAIVSYLSRERGLDFNPFDADYLKDHRILLILDGLDKYPLPASRRGEGGRRFVQNVIALCSGLNSEGGKAKLQVILTGNSLTFQACGDLFYGRSLLEILPFYPGTEREQGWWPQSTAKDADFLKVDQRQEWWTRWSKLTGQKISMEVSVIDSFGVEGLARRPFFNYVVAHAKRDIGMDLNHTLTLQELYSRLIDFMLEKVDTQQKIQPEVFHLCLEEIAVWIWRGELFDVTPEKIQKHLCSSSFLHHFLEEKVDLATAGMLYSVIQILYRAHDLGTLYLAFEKKLLGDYLVASRILRLMEKIYEEQAGSQDRHSAEDRSVRHSLLLWAEVTAPAPMNLSTFYFLRTLVKDTLRNVSKKEQERWQAVFSGLFSVVVIEGFPMEEVRGMETFQSMVEGEYNAGTALISALGDIALMTERVSPVTWKEDQTRALGAWLMKMNGQHADYLSASFGFGVSQLIQSPLILRSLCYLNFSRQILTVQNLASASLKGAVLTGVSLDRSSLRFADLRRVDLGRSKLREVAMNRADLREANLDEAILSAARMEACRLDDASLIRAKLNHVDLSRAQLRGCSLSWSSMNNSLLRNVVLDGARMNGAQMNDCNFTRGSLRNVVLDAASARRANFTKSCLDDASCIDGEFNQAVFTGTSLLNTCFYQAELRAARFLRCKMASVNLESCDLTNSIFQNCDLEKGNLNNANLSKIIFKSRCDFHGASFNGAILKGTLFQNADLRMALFEKAKFSDGTRFVQCDLSGADFNDVDLRGINMAGCKLKGGTFIGSSFIKADLSCSNLRSAILDGANLSEGNFQKTLFEESSFFRAELKGTNLIGAKLQKANLHGADLENAKLNRADLSGASLYGASLVGADLNHAILTGATLFGANLEGARIHNTQLSKEQKRVIRGIPNWISDDEVLKGLEVSPDDSLESLTISEERETVIEEDGLIIEESESVSVVGRSKSKQNQTDS